MTSLGLGLNYSNRNFKQTGGPGIPFLKISPTDKFHQLITSNVIFNFRAQYRYVLHNSMLEGYGIFKHNIDEDNTSPKDAYFLSGSQVKRNIFLAELSINIRLKYCGIVYKQSIMSPEFNLPVNSKIYDFANNGQPGLHNRSAWNHYGTIGLIFKVQ